MSFATSLSSISALTSLRDPGTELARGFPAQASVTARVLILGSLPGDRSIAAGEYYAHPRNVFWRIVGELFEIPASLPYTERMAALNRSGVAVWDVLQASRRSGSLDSSIEVDSARCNDFNALFDRCRRIERVAFNGRKAEALFRRLVVPQLRRPAPAFVSLPSTSPAYASMRYEEKLRRWRQLAEHLE